VEVRKEKIRGRSRMNKRRVKEGSEEESCEGVTEEEDGEKLQQYFL